MVCDSRGICDCALTTEQIAAAVAARGASRTFQSATAVAAAGVARSNAEFPAAIHRIKGCEVSRYHSALSLPDRLPVPGPSFDSFLAFQSFRETFRVMPSVAGGHLRFRSCLTLSPDFQSVTCLHEGLFIKRVRVPDGPQQGVAWR